MKQLLLDLEVAPLTVHTWQLHDVTIGINQILRSGYTLCWSAKWAGKPTMHSGWRYKTEAKKMLAPLHALINEADSVITYNGKAYDLKIVRKDFLLHGFAPTAPHKDIDLLQVMRNRFRLASNKLGYVVKELGIGEKLDAGGHETWLQCMEGDEKAYKRMLRYNRRDVVILEALYNKLLPWIPNVANAGLYDEADGVCPRCGGHVMQRRGFARTMAGKYARYQCAGCGGWSRSGYTDTSREQRKELLRPV